MAQGHPIALFHCDYTPCRILTRDAQEGEDMLETYNACVNLLTG